MKTSYLRRSRITGSLLLLTSLATACVETSERETTDSNTKTQVFKTASGRLMSAGPEAPGETVEIDNGEIQIQGEYLALALVGRSELFEAVNPIMVQANGTVKAIRGTIRDSSTPPQVVDFSAELSLAIVNGRLQVQLSGGAMSDRSTQMEMFGGTISAIPSGEDRIIDPGTGGGGGSGGGCDDPFVYTGKRAAMVRAVLRMACDDENIAISFDLQSPVAPTHPGVTASACQRDFYVLNAIISCWSAEMQIRLDQKESRDLADEAVDKAVESFDAALSLCGNPPIVGPGKRCATENWTCEIIRGFLRRN